MAADQAGITRRLNSALSAMPARRSRTGSPGRPLLIDSQQAVVLIDGQQAVVGDQLGGLPSR